ncbi:hypothetical protein D3C85_1513390 [compost metagenome]
MRFCGTHVRAAQQQVNRYSLQYGTVDQGHHTGIVMEFRYCARRATDQGGQRIACACDLRLEVGDGAQGSQVLGLGLLQIELGIITAGEQALGDLIAALLQFGVVLGNAQARLGGA